MNTILVVDDEEGIRFSLRGILEDEGYEVREAASGEEALEDVAERRPDLVFLDIWLPGVDGLSVLGTLQKDLADVPVIMISGHGNIETAVSAIKNGAFDFIEKPLSLEKVVIAASKALEFKELKRENLSLRARINTDQVQRLTGESSSIKQLREQIGRVAPTDAWVLITGENGTGKEIVARMTHAESKRAEKPMIAVNCAAIPEELIEAELFGHEKGAFTGAERSSEGKFELADGGTLFLDEIGDMSLKTQAKILRILQEQRFERVGGRKTISVDVRVIAATNKDLTAEIEAGNFREDLYYRLKVFPLHVPPLRERSKDVPLLMKEFTAAMSREHGFKPIGFSDEALRVVEDYSWPGNVRELKNFVERMLIMCGGRTVGVDDLPPELARGAPTCARGESGEGDLAGLLREDVDLKTARQRFEAQYLASRLAECDGNVSRLAEVAGVERSTLYRKLKALGVQVSE
ncbi:sigma-54-dependent transcriptional regulator [Desulfohalovibrio reitneri]|uniref:sigma-54-dependent transcriptional regulator n=1 Tax=Desulfohalovibrio reitneri TaxID=1307759 RepID=UPI0004A74F9D|nr:sigma-54 dependent transcriptional regulator [Desulfohalovibrio reitneri]